MSLVAAMAGTIFKHDLFHHELNPKLHRISKLSAPEENIATASSNNEPPESSSILLLRQWDSTYTTGHLLAPGTTLFSLLAYLVAARLAPSNVKKCYYLAAASAAAALPFSILFVIPKNSELYRRSAVLRQRNDPQTENTHLEGKGKFAGADNVTMIREGLVYSKIRALLPVPAILISFYAVMKTGELIRIT